MPLRPAIRHRLLAAAAALLLSLAPGTGRCEEPKPPVRVGMGLAKPPYLSDEVKGGLEYDIAEAAFAAAGYSMAAVRLPPARALAMERAGELDAMLTVDEGIGGHGFFSEPYIVYRNAAITLASRRLALRSVADLAGLSVAGFQNASSILGPAFAAMSRQLADYREYPRQETQAKLLFAGRVDVAICDRLVFSYFASRLGPEFDPARPVELHAIFPPSPRKAVFPDRALRDRFDAGLRAIKANGAYEAILRRYGALDAGAR